MNRFIFIVFFCCLILPSVKSEASFYVSGSMGASKVISESEKSHGNFGGAIGYSFPVLAKAEMFYMKDRYHLIGALGRFSPLSFLSLNGGIVRRLTSSGDREPSKNGVLFGPGINFWLIPIIDAYADLHYMRVSNDSSVVGVGGIRFHF